MSSFVRSSALAVTVVLSFGASSGALAERPVWTPIAELLVGSLGKSDPQRLSDVMTRCTALSMTLSGLTADFSEEMAQLYRSQANRFIEHSLRIDSMDHKQRTGREPDMAVLEAATLAELQTLMLGYGEWMDQNILDGGSLFDKEIELEMESCQLATRLVSQLPMAINEYPVQEEEEED
ncbi:MAG: hypothetical protein LBE21_01055 [Pseudomonadales bacterium]|jgi:hypothetical protein|nr:hypothetical protein [Pseudomonadales bacterium]